MKEWQKQSLIFLCVSVLLVLLPFVIFGFYIGDDFTYHVLRVEGLAQNLKMSNFFPYIDPIQIYHLGNGGPMLYPYIFLYPLAISVALGGNLLISWICMMVLINFCGMWIAYFVGKRLFKTQIKAFLFSFIYY